MHVPCVFSLFHCAPPTSKKLLDGGYLHCITTAAIREGRKQMICSSFPTVITRAYYKIKTAPPRPTQIFTTSACAQSKHACTHAHTHARTHAPKSSIIHLRIKPSAPLSHSLKTQLIANTHKLCHAVSDFPIWVSECSSFMPARLVPRHERRPLWTQSL